jgi:hypothetical protein
MGRYADGLPYPPSHVQARFQPSTKDLPEPRSRVGLFLSLLLPLVAILLSLGSIWWYLKGSANGSYDERVLPSIGNEVLKATVAQFDGKSPQILKRSGANTQLLSLLRIEKSSLLGLGMIS